MKIDFKKYNAGKANKNVLYRIDSSQKIYFTELHDDSEDVLGIYYNICDGQYGIYANEYRRPQVDRNGCKAADVLACVVDEAGKKVRTLILDVKSNISSFSCDLKKENAVVTAIKRARDFVQQLHDEMLHKDSFMIYLKDEGYTEEQNFGIATRCFESKKYHDVADFMEEILQTDVDPTDLITLNLLNILKPYEYEIPKIRNFANQKVLINGVLYPLHIYILEKDSENNYVADVTMDLKADIG